jgi:hypothetical protein
MSTPAPPSNTAGPADPASAGFAIHWIGRDFDQLPTDYDDPGGAWPKLLAEAQLGDVFITDHDVEAVSTAPLTLILTGAAGQRMAKAWRESAQFAVTLDGARLYAGTTIFIGTARVLRHPLIHLLDRGISINLHLVPTIGARADTARNAPPALLDHFRRAGKLLPAGSPPSPRTRKRRLLATVTNTKPGDPASQVDAQCDDDAAKCAVTLSFRKPGTTAGQWDVSETIDAAPADFEALWVTAMNVNLYATRPGPYPHPNFEPPRVIHPPRFRFVIEAERLDGTVLSNDQSWSSPSPSDRTTEPFFIAAGALGRRLTKGVPVRYFP